MQLKHLTWTDVADYLEKCKTIIVPLGSVEQHGPSLPLGTDMIAAEAMAIEVGRRVNRLVGPVLSPGVSLIPHMNFSGTVSFMPRTYTKMIREYLETLYQHGFRDFLLINGHGGNDGSIKNALIELRYRLEGLKFGLANWWNLPDIAEKTQAVVGHGTGHACAIEASLIWHIDEQLVKKDRFTKEYKDYPFQVSNDLAEKYLTQSGLINADQTKASKELGREIFEMAVENYLKLLQAMEEH